MSDPLDGFVEVPAGAFVYGPEACYERLELAPEPRPETTLTLPGFLMGRTPVTYAGWREFLEATGHPWAGSWWRVATPAATAATVSRMLGIGSIQLRPVGNSAMR